MATCYHCGDACESKPIVHDEKEFCCNGCKTVYTILKENGMDSYYAIADKPGIKPKSSESKYAFLDNEELARELVNFKEGNLTSFTAFLPAVHCSSCIWLLENLHKLQPGVRSSQVNFVRKEATIVFDHSVLSLRKMAELLDTIGYAPTLSKGGRATQKKQTKFTIQLGVAAFGFGNIMLFSFPEYLQIDDTYEEYRDFFAYLILAISIPILVFSAQDYLISAFKALRTKVLNLDVPISLGILVLYAKSAYDIFMGHGPGYMDSFAGFIFFLLIGKWFQNKTYQALSFDRDYTSYFPLAVKRVSHGREEIVQIEHIKPGDEIVLHNEEILPADAVLLDTRARMDYSFVTGESDAIDKVQGETLFAGGKLLGRAVHVSIKEQVKRSYLTDLWNNDVFRKEKPGLSRIQDTLSRYFLAILLVVTALIAAVWVYIDIQMVVPVVTAVLIVACPCALSLSYPFTFGNILRAIGRSGLYLKNTRVIEDLDSITDIVFDKTGTLTEGSAQDVGYEGEALTAEQLSLLSFATKSSTHPMSVAIRAYLQNHYTWNDQHEGSFEEIPGLGIQVTHGNHSLKLGSYRFVDVAKKEDETASYVQWNGQVVGRFYVRQHFRSGLRELISGLQTRGYKLHVLTGDNERARKELETLFGPDAEFNFHQSPQMKLAYVKQLEESGRRVLMFGDGLNDAGALQQSTTGIAVSDNVYQFSPACDGILDAAHFQKIPHILTLSQYGRKALRVCFIFSLLYNIVGLSFASTGLLSPLIAAILMPLSSVTVVFMSFVLIWRKSRKLGML